MLDLMRVLVLIVALGIVALGIVGAGIGFAIGLTADETDRLVALTFSVSLAIVTAGLGLTLAWHAWRASQKQPSSAFRLRKIWPLGLLTILSVAMGQVVLSRGLLPSFTFPLLHIGATVLPPVIIVALVARGLEAAPRTGEAAEQSPGHPHASWRDIVLQISSGAFLATSLVFVLEAIALLGVAIVLLAGVAVQPDGPDLLQQLAKYLQDPTWTQDSTTLALALMSPVVLAAAFLFVSGLIPLIEEAIKAIGVGLMIYRQPSLAQAFLWGLAGGAGFAMVEGLFNTANSLDAWAPVILLRMGATLLHCFTGALMGLAWYSVLVRRRWQHGLGLYVASVAIHGLWNALSVGMTLLSLSTLTADIAGSAGRSSPTAAGLGIAAILASMVVVSLAIALGLWGLTAYVRKRSRAPEPSVIQPTIPTTGTISSKGTSREG